MRSTPTLSPPRPRSIHCQKKGARWRHPAPAGMRHSDQHGAGHHEGREDAEGALEVHPAAHGRGPASALMSAPAIGNSNTSDPHTATVDVFIRSSRRGHRRPARDRAGTPEVIRASPTTTSAAATDDHERKHLALLAVEEPAVADKHDVDSVEHQLDAHRHHDGIAPDQHPEKHRH